MTAGRAGRGGGGDDAADLPLAATVAQRFYVDERNKQSIAEELGISRFKVARLLALAKEAGLVTIEIHPPLGLDVAAGDELRRRYGLAEAWVLGRELSDDDALRTQLGQLGARWLRGATPADGAIGLSWGRTMAAVVDAVDVLPRCQVVQVAGGLPSAFDDGASRLVHRLAARSGGQVSSLHAPLLTSDARVADSLLADPANAATVTAFSNLDLVMLGVGSWPGASPLRPALHDDDVVALARRGAVAEICGMFLDTSGSIIDEGLRDRTIAIGPAALAQVPSVIAVAGGRSKAAAIGALLRSGVCTHLITDIGAVRALDQGA